MTQRRTVLKGLATAALLPLAGHAMAQSGNMPVNPDDIRVGLEKQGNYEVLEVNIMLPEGR